MGRANVNIVVGNSVKESIDFPDEVEYPNFMSLNKAKILNSQGKKLIPSFDDFIGALKCYGELEFYYCNKNILRIDTQII